MNYSFNRKSIFEPKQKLNYNKRELGIVNPWNKMFYNKWIEDQASVEGAENAYNMTKNALHEPELINYVKKMIQNHGENESPLERIQWDIENYI